MAITVLADENVKFTVLLEAPANPELPTAVELNAGEDLSFRTLFDDFQWGAAASEKIGERLLGEGSASQKPGAGNYNLGFTILRQFAVGGGGFDATQDAVFEAIKVKGTTFWGYVRRMDKKASTVWATGDEIACGGEVTSDTPETPDNGGSIKYRISPSATRMADFVEVPAGA